MNIPEVRIQFSWLLYDTVSITLHEKLAKPGEELPSQIQCEEWTNDYRQAWQSKQRKILTALCSELNLEFRRPVLDVDLAPWLRPISSPLLMGFQNKPDQFVDVLTHELCHVLLTDNNIQTNRGKSETRGSMLQTWKKLFGEDHDFVTLVHIPVHACLKFVYLDILREPERLQRDIEHCNRWPAYKKAWEYIEAHDYQTIINQVKKSYKQYESEK